MNTLKNFIRQDDGVTAMEYGLIAALVAVVIIAALVLVGGQLDTIFREIAARLVVP